jgi:heptosyltransferase-3
MQAPASVLVVSLRYLGDVLLTTGVTHALRTAWPQARIGMLVFADTAAMLEGNPDLNAVHALSRHAGWRERFRFAASLWNRYQLALIVQTGDRPHLFGWAMARQRVGLVQQPWTKRLWKERLLARSLVADPALHRVTEYARLPAALDLGSGAPRLVPPSAGMTARQLSELAGFDVATQPFALLHPAPRRRYKRWHAPGWRALITALRARGLRVAVTAAPVPAEIDYVAEVLGDESAQVVDLRGRLSLAETADLLRYAAAYVGPDTATTHLAAACGTATVALYGPTDPRLWGPWPVGGLSAPYEKSFALQRRGNVALLQNPALACVPCQLEGCERHRDSHSQCLDELPVEAVLTALDRLGLPPGPTRSA